MNAERWQRITGIFHEALAQDSEVRAAFVRDACGDDDSLRREVHRLLAAHIAAGGFGDTPGLDVRLDARMKPATMFGEYRIDAFIGAGGMGEVFRAIDMKLGRQVALKILPDVFARDPDRVRRFHREAQLLAALNHPHIAQIFGLEVVDGVTALVMELVDGPTLADRIREGPVAVVDAVSIAIRIAGALDSAHQQGIVHRDLKPANIKVSEDGTVKVLDFGLAKSLDLAAGIAPVESPRAMPEPTQQGLILGTPAYRSPEQARGGRVDKRTDIWAFGCVLYEMLTGRPAFSGASVADTIAAVLSRAPDWSQLPDGVPLHVRALLVRCLEQDPRRRARDIGDVWLELEHSSEHRLEADAEGRMTRRTGRMALLAAAAVAAVAAAVMLLIMAGSAAPPPDVVRFTIAPPDGTGFTPSAGDMPAVELAMAPDGRSVAFVAAPFGGRQLLWIRRLDESDVKAIPGTVDAAYPFWSPDSGYLGYFSTGKMMRVDLSGGRPHAIADVRDGRGGTWNRAGKILFAEGQDGLYSVGENGGVPNRVTTIDRNRRETSHRWPQFLPDGTQFLYFVDSGDAQVRGIYRGGLDGRPSQLVRTSSFAGVFAKPGHLLFVDDGNLVAQPLDVASRSRDADASTLLRGVGGTSLGYSAYSVSDNRVLAYSPPFNPERELVWFSRAGERLERVDGPADYVDFRLASDDRVAVARNVRDVRTSDIYVVDRSRGTERRLTTHPALDASPVWSPDTTQVVFRSKRRNAATDNPNNLYLVEADGSEEPRLLLSTEAGKYPTDWSPDGRSVVYHTLSAGAGWDVWLLPLGEDRVPNALIATAANEMQAKFSPDGRWIAYTSDESGRPEVYVKSYPTDARTWRVSVDGGAQPLWTSDRRELLFVAPVGTLMAASVDVGSQFRIRSIQPHFRLPAPGLSPPFSPNYAVSRDGKRVLVNAARREGSSPAVEVVLNWPSLLVRAQ